jgi:hypothetical protein
MSAPPPPEPPAGPSGGSGQSAGPSGGPGQSAGPGQPAGRGQSAGPAQPGQQAAPPPRYRRPSAGPTAEDLQDRARWQELTDTSLPSVQAAAEKWRTGLAAFVTLATGGLLLKGPGAASDLTTGWLIPLTILALGGLLAAIGGLWLALRAAAGTPAKLNLSEIVTTYGGVRQFEVACALRASDQLRWARLLVAVSLAGFVAAIGTWWWAPSAPAQPPAMIQISTPAGPICGTLIGARGEAFTVLPAGQSVTTRIPFSSARDARIVQSC